jgi:hypothetical protein
MDYVNGRINGQKHMARRPLVKWEQGSYYIESLPLDDERLDLTWRERGKMLLGFVVVIAFVVVVAIAGGGQ